MSLIRQLRSILSKNDAAPLRVTNPTQTERRRKKRYSHTGRRILIIDDSPTVVASLGKTLRSAGCLITEAGDAESGMDVARSGKPDLIFLDIVLPGISGFAALRQMRKEQATSRIPVILISGNEQATEQFYAKRIGADDFMKKPFARHEVFARIDALVNAGKLPQLELDSKPENGATNPAAHTQALELPVPPAPTPAATAETAPRQPPLPPRQERRTPHLPNEAIARMSPMEARQRLASMGLQYFSQEQFNAAVKRADKLAVDLFIIGGGIQVK